MQVDALQGGFAPGIKVPAVLATLCEYTDRSKGQTSCDFALTDDGYNALLDAFDEDEAAAGQFGIEPPTQAEARVIVDRARAAHPDLDSWMKEWAKAHFGT